MTFFQALQDMPFSKGYWDWQHPFLIDSVQKFSFPALFITINPSEWSFPVPFWPSSSCKRVSGWSYIFLQFNEKGTHIDEVSSVPLLKISHPSYAHSIGVQGYIDTILSSLSNMDVQTVNGKKMLMRYVSSYVTKSQESIHTDASFRFTVYFYIIPSYYCFQVCNVMRHTRT